jgi:hypothetical protein
MPTLITAERVKPLSAPHAAYQLELLDLTRSIYLNGSSLSKYDLVRNKCGEWTQSFVERFPSLMICKGFFNGQEHLWCVERAGLDVTSEGVLSAKHWDSLEIVDPTAPQFGASWGSSAAVGEYCLIEEDKYPFIIGRCMDCGSYIYHRPGEDDLPKDGGRLYLCPPGTRPDVECSYSLSI